MNGVTMEATLAQSQIMLRALGVLRRQLGEGDRDYDECLSMEAELDKAVKVIEKAQRLDAMPKKVYGVELTGSGV